MTSSQSSSRRSPGSDTRARLAARALFLSIAVAGVATAPQQPAQNPQPSQFRGGVDLVQVDVTVLDKSGTPITNLAIADFDVRESGALQRVDTLTLMTANPALLPPAATTSAPIPTPPATPGVPTRPLPPRVFVFVFDLAHLSASGFDRTRTAIRSFLNDGLRPGDFAGIVVNGSMIGNQIITDRVLLLQHLDGIKLPGASRYALMRQWPKIIDEEEAYTIAVRRLREALEAAVQRACAEQPGECQGPGGRARAEGELEAKAAQLAGESQHDAQNALDMLKALANGLGRFPGPKHVLLFSEGFYTGEFSDRVTDVSSLAARNNVRISTLDARGLNADPRMQELLAAAPLMSTADRLVLGTDVNADVLTTLALETGGERVRNRNVLRPALDRIAEISGTYYLLGYSPTTPFDGKYRKIEVKVRREDVTVVARRGYLAVRTVRPSPPPAGPPVVAVPPASSAPDRVRFEDTRAGAGITAGLAAPGTAAAEHAGALARQGWALYGQGKVEAARDKLAAASAAGGGIWADYALALAEFTLRNAAAAAPLWERVRKAEPGYEPVYFDLADAYLTLGRRADAVVVLREAARRWPKDPETHNALGVVLLHRNAIDDAIASFERAVAVAPDDPTGYFNVGSALHTRYLQRIRGSSGLRALGTRDRERAIQAYRKYLTMDGPNAAQIKNALAALEWK